MKYISCNDKFKKREPKKVLSTFTPRWSRVPAQVLQYINYQLKECAYCNREIRVCERFCERGFSLQNFLSSLELFENLELLNVLFDFELSRIVPGVT